MSLQDPILSILPHEIVIKILSLLSLDSLFRLRWASKSWLHLITRHLPNNSFRPPPAVAGYYFQYPSPYHPLALTTDYVDESDTDDIAVDVDLSFFPRRPPAILDSCNGLLLCTPDRPFTSSSSYGSRVHCVCNPVTGSWITLPDQFEPRHYPPQGLQGPSFLGFKPWVSPYFYVLSTESRRGGWSIYSSKTGRWSKKRTLGGGHFWPYYKNDIAIWNGDAYAILRRQEKLKVCIETVRFGLGKGGKEETIVFPEIAERLIRHPRSMIQPQTCIGKLGGELCFVHLHGLGLTVWSLGSGGRGVEWKLKHASNIDGFQRLDPEPVAVSTFYGIVAFNPTAGVVLVLHKGTVYSYDLDRMELEEVYGFVGFVRAFPFSPCLFDVFQDGDDCELQKHRSYKDQNSCLARD